MCHTKWLHNILAIFVKQHSKILTAGAPRRRFMPKTMGTARVVQHCQQMSIGICDSHCLVPCHVLHGRGTHYPISLYWERNGQIGNVQKCPICYALCLLSIPSHCTMEGMDGWGLYLVSCPDPPRKVERGSGVLNDFSCHMDRVKQHKECNYCIPHALHAAYKMIPSVWLLCQCPTALLPRSSICL